MWFRWLREAARVGDRTSLMREQLDDGRYEKIRKKMMEPEYEFHLEPDVQTAGQHSLSPKRASGRALRPPALNQSPSRPP